MSLLTHRRALLSAKGKALLPKEYQQVEYLESTGAQYIDTGYKPNQNTEIQTVFIIGSSSFCCYGARVSSTNTVSLTCFISTPARMGSASVVTNGFISDGNTKNIVIHNKDSITINGTVFRFTNVGTFQLSSNLGIGYIIYGSGASSSGKFKGKWYSFDIYESGILVRNFIPCYRKADNEAGLYDLVNDKFYTNKGTGEFILGNEIAN